MVRANDRVVRAGCKAGPARTRRILETPINWILKEENPLIRTVHLLFIAKIARPTVGTAHLFQIPLQRHKAESISEGVNNPSDFGQLSYWAQSAWSRIGKGFPYIVFFLVHNGIGDGSAELDVCSQRLFRSHCLNQWVHYSQHMARSWWITSQHFGCERSSAASAKMSKSPFPSANVSTSGNSGCKTWL